MSAAATGFALSVRGLVASYGAAPVLHSVDLTVADGGLTCLLGANGAGKTTILRAIMGLLPFHRGQMDSGTVLLGARDITWASTRSRVEAGLALVPEGRRLFADLTIEQNLRLGASARRDRNVGSDIEAVLERFPALRRPRLQAGYLSGGEQQMLAIGRALMARPKVLLLDEPTLGLAPRLVDEVLDVVARLCADGLSVLLADQNAERALKIATDAYVLRTGAVVASGPAAVIAGDPVIRDSYLGAGV